MLDFKIEQVAIATDNPDELKKQLSLIDKKFADPSKWTEDTVITFGKIHGKMPNETIANLSFFYEAGIEFEILEYVEGDNWHKSSGRSGTFISHIGMHVDEFPELPFEIIQNVITENHTNDFLVKSGRKYIYKIYNTRGLLGFDLKLIKRIEKNEKSK